MTIAFVGYRGSFQYKGIGGTDSIVRRIANYVSKNHSVALVTYGHSSTSETDVAKNIKQVCLKSSKDLFRYINLADDIEHLICIYLRPVDIIRSFFSIKRKDTCHWIVTSYNQSTFKRLSLFILLSAIYNGVLFCVSPRIYDLASKFSSRSKMLYPPVDDNFFLESSMEVISSPVKVGYMGRLDYGKGADIAYNYFQVLSNDPRFECCMYSYPHSSDFFSMDLHRQLKNQSLVRYQETELHSYSQETDVYLGSIIDSTDIFFLPYRYIESTVDSPLVPLEIMARGKPFLCLELPELSFMKYHNLAFISKGEINSLVLSDRLLDVIQENWDKECVVSFSRKIRYKTSHVSQQILDNIQL